MNLPPSITVSALLILTALTTMGGEVLIHSGPTTSTPISSLSSPERTTEELVFVKQFYIESGQLAKLPAPHQPAAAAPLDMERATGLAKATVDPGGTPREFKVVKTELMVTTVGDSQAIDYYLVEILVNGSSEHRIVLMDGSVLKPRLKRVKSAGK